MIVSIRHHAKEDLAANHDRREDRYQHSHLHRIQTKTGSERLQMLLYAAKNKKQRKKTQNNYPKITFSQNCFTNVFANLGYFTEL